MTGGVLVTDGDERSTLAVVRSLGRAGYRVAVTSRSARCLAGSSRFVGRSWRAPDPLRDPEGFAAALSEIVRRTDPDVLLPMTEASLLAALSHRDRYGDARIPFPSLETFLAITDKARVAEAARRVGIAVPTQVTVVGPDDASDDEVRELRFPVVLKPTRSVGEVGEVRRKVGVVHVESPDGYRSAVQDLPSQAFPLLVQEKIEGAGAGVFVLVRHGEVLAHFSHRRIREKPPSGGVSVCRESVPADPTLVERSRRLLEAFDWEGVAMVEFKVARDSGEPYIMEVNPRFWGSLQLAIDAGVDFPRLLVEQARGEPTEAVNSYEIGVRTRWWWGEVDHFIARVREAVDTGNAGRTMSALAAGARSLLSGWREPGRPEVWSWTDPLPFIHETVDWFSRLGEK